MNKLQAIMISYSWDDTEFNNFMNKKVKKIQNKKH